MGEVTSPKTDRSKGRAQPHPGHGRKRCRQTRQLPFTTESNPPLAPRTMLAMSNESWTHVAPYAWWFNLPLLLGLWTLDLQAELGCALTSVASRQHGQSTIPAKARSKQLEIFTTLWVVRINTLSMSKPELYRYRPLHTSKRLLKSFSSRPKYLV